MNQQAVTPELRKFIMDQAEAGVNANVVFNEMLGMGWHEEIARRAMNEARELHLRLLSPGAEPVQVPARPAASFPHIDLSGSPRMLDLGDRLVQVLTALRSPEVVVLGGLLSDEECDALVEAARPRMTRSTVVDSASGSSVVQDGRTSMGMFYGRAETDLIRRIEARLARLVNWPVENGEGIQVLNYQPGAEYRPHFDFFEPNKPGSAKVLQRGGQRVATVVMYLNDPESGGGTTFPDAGGLVVAPQKGNAVFFAYHSPDPGTKTLHGGAPLLAGEKWAATKWLREGPVIDKAAPAKADVSLA